MERKKQLDMLHGPIWNKIPQFALPVADRLSGLFLLKNKEKLL